MVKPIKHKEKRWLWRLTWPFAHANYTTVGHTIYFPKGEVEAHGQLLKHEMVHVEQQEKWTIFGRPLWLFLYLAPNYPFAVWLLLWLFSWQDALYLTPVALGIGLPILWNPWRWRWEYEAFTKGSNWSHQDTVDMLRSQAYGWLIFHRRKKK